MCPFFEKRIQKRLGQDSPAIRFTSLRSVFAIARFRGHGHSFYSGLLGAKFLAKRLAV